MDTDEARKAMKNQLRRSAMDTLARREHSRYELAGKLEGKFPEATAELVSEVLDQLEADRLLSDERFAEAYIRYRRSRGFGPVAIRHHLRSCKVEESLVQSHLDEADPEWQHTLNALYTRKTGQEPGGKAPEPRLRQKLERFFLTRGFSWEHIRRLWRS